MQKMLDNFRAFIKTNWTWGLLAIPLSFVYWIWTETFNWLLVDVPANASADALSSIRGTFGDKFGAVNALFSGLSLIGIATAILYQHKELQTTKEALRAEKVDRERQQFEYLFFQLITALPSSAEKIILGQLSGYQALKGVTKYRPPYGESLENPIKHHIYLILHVLILIENTDKINKDLYFHLLRDSLNADELMALRFFPKTDEIAFIYSKYFGDLGLTHPQVIEETD